MSSVIIDSLTELLDFVRVCVENRTMVLVAESCCGSLIRAVLSQLS